MHRTAGRAIRAARLAAAARALANPASASHRRRPADQGQQPQQPQPKHRHAQATEPSPLSLESSMFFLRRGISYAVLSTLVGLGAWFVAHDGAGGGAGILDNPLVARSFAVGGVGPASGTGTDQPLSDPIPTRKVLVVGANGLHTGTVVGDGPLSKTTSDDGRKIVEMVTPDQANSMLRRAEQSFLVSRGEGVVRYDMVQLPSNDPIEDDHAEQIIEMKDGSQPHDWMFWGVFDGHRGWTTSAKLRQTLIGTVAQAINETYLDAGSSQPAPSAIDDAIKHAFMRLDYDIVHRSVERVFKSNSQAIAAEVLAPAFAGSCALLSFYDTSTKELRVACTGDSRAVLGRRGPSGLWTATALSVDQTGSNPDEETRIRRLHPGEPGAISRGRVLGRLEPSRAFGDASYKWTAQVSERLRNRFFGSGSIPQLLTPPYVTAEPEITTTAIRPEDGDFLVMATDGLWEMLTNEEVVGLVGKWLETRPPRRGLAPAPAAAPSRGQSPSMWSRILETAGWSGDGGGVGGPGLPVEQKKPQSGREESGGGQKTPVRQRQWGASPQDHGHYVVKDKNAATHLIRNALGGQREEQVCALLTLPAPHARRYRDDLTVQVIFFGQGETTGEVRVNLDATAGSDGPIKAKL